MKLGFKGEQAAQDNDARRGRFFTLKERVRPAASAAHEAEPLQLAHEIGARFEMVTEKLDNAQRVADEIRGLITLLGDIRGPIIDEFRERRVEHAELLAARTTIEGARERLEELERVNLELVTRAAGAEASLADAESRVTAQESTLRSRDVEIEQLKLERAERRAQVGELETAHAAASARLAEVEDDAAAFRSRAEVAEARHRESESQANKLQQDRVLSEQEHIVLQKRLDQANAEAAQLGSRLAQVEEQLSNERKRALDLENGRLAAEAETAKAARVLEGKLETQRTDLSALEAKLEASLARVAKLDELNTGLTQRLAEANLRHKVTEDEKSALVHSTERAAASAQAREQETDAMRRDFLSLEAARAAAVERAEELARLAASRETAAKRAERQIALLKERLEVAQADHARKRAVLDERLSKMQTQYERERAERAIIEGALETARRDRGRDQESEAPTGSRESA
jgi:crescentin